SPDVRPSRRGHPAGSRHAGHGDRRALVRRAGPARFRRGRKEMTMPGSRLYPIGPRKTIAAATGIIALAALSACASHSNGASSGGAGTGTVNVAVVQALTGPGAVDGQVNLEGSELAAATIN